MSHPAQRNAARSSRRALAVLGAAVALLMGPASLAQAHDVLVSTSPADGSTTAIVPAQVTLTFAEPALAIGTDLVVTGPAGQVQDGAAVLVDNTVTEHVRPGSPAGRYRVTWRVTSADGHTVSGDFSFTARAPSPTQLATTGLPPAPTSTSSADAAGSTPASTSSTATAAGADSAARAGGQSSALWWAGGAVAALLLLVAFIVTRRPRTTPESERDPHP